MKVHKVVALLTVADPEIGLGHLNRCDALSQALLLGWNSRFRLVVSCRAGDLWLDHHPPASKYLIADWNNDLAATRDVIAGADLVVVDSYRLADDVWDFLCQQVRRLAVFDDTGENPPFEGLLINGSPGTNLVKYRAVSGRKLLLGSAYQVLRPPFWVPTQRIVQDQISRVVVMAGGTDHGRVLEDFVTIADQVLPHEAEILAFGRLDEPVSGRVLRNRFVSADELRTAFDKADLLITAGGQTVAEGVACALPTVMIQTASNQDINVRGWSETGSARFAGRVWEPDWKSTFARILNELLPFRARESLSRKARQIDLARSTYRLARELIRFGSKEGVENSDLS